jgi:hypothetical protein
MPEKRFRLRADEIRPMAPGRGYCFATDHITVDGSRVGYMYREHPDEASDSGWRFFSGQESDEYANDPANLAIYDVNTIANYDPEIIPLLDSPFGSAFARDGQSGRFLEELFSPLED